MNGEQSNASPPDLSDIIAAASYIEQLLWTEHSWMTNRLSWLFLSQSFCIVAYTVLLTSDSVRQGAEQQVEVLLIGLPLLGIVCSVAVGFAVHAACAIGAYFANERARLAKRINEHLGTKIPIMGIDAGLCDHSLKPTLWRGALPQYLPWVLVLLWLALLLRVSFDI